LFPEEVVREYRLQRSIAGLKGPTQKHVGPYLSTFDLAAELGVSDERIRQLVVRLFTPKVSALTGTPERPELSEIVFKNESGYWQIPRSWADKYKRLRAAYQREKFILRELTRIYGRAAGGDNPLDEYLRADETVLVEGELVTLHAPIVTVLEKAFGQLPFVLATEEETVLRAIEALNSRTRITFRNCWTDDLAKWIERDGPLWIERP